MKAVLKWLPAWTRQGGILPAAVLVFLVLAAIAGPAPTHAADEPETDQAVLEAEEPGPVTRKQALDRVRYRFPGEVIAISEITDAERPRYRIRLDNQGNIFTVYVDQATGRVSRE